MRLKSRKLKLKSQNSNKKVIIIAIVAAVLVVAGIIAGLIIVGANNASIAKGNEIKGIYIAKAPDKTKYYIGDQADYTGLEIQVLKNNGSSEIITYTPANAYLFEITGFNSNLPQEKQTITVKYKGFSTGFNISIFVYEAPAGTLTGIGWVTLPKTEYKVGDFFETDGGMLLKEYNDGKTKRTILLDSHISGKDKAFVNGKAKNIGTYELTVKYKENGVTVYTTYTITVTE